jgi:hypothetical protein
MKLFEQLKFDVKDDENENKTIFQSLFYFFLLLNEKHLFIIN